MSNLRTCYEQAKSGVDKIEEPFQFVQAVEEHRNFWKPDKVRVLLLAESHVCSKETSTIDKKSLPLPLRGNLPISFAGVIYCLAYGEEQELLIEKGQNKRSGTPQFWKLFYSTVNQVSSDKDFSPVLKGGTKGFGQRLENKIKLLETMQEKGVWLLDASRVALYPKEEFPAKRREVILAICWEHYISPIIKRDSPENIIVIGKDVAKMLANQLEELTIPHQSIKQPRGYRGSGDSQREERFRDYRKLYDAVCL